MVKRDVAVGYCLTDDPEKDLCNDALAIQKEIHGPRTENEIANFYKRVKASKLHNNVSLPPKSKTFGRHSKLSGYVLMQTESDIPTNKRCQNIHYRCFDSNCKRCKWPPKKKHDAMIILIRPGRYDLRQLALTELGASNVEIIGEGASPSDVILHCKLPTCGESEEIDESPLFQLSGDSALRLCNFSLFAEAFDGVISGTGALEMERIIARSVDPDTAFIVSSSSGSILLKDCTFSSTAGNAVYGSCEAIAMIHCKFMNCGLIKDREINDPYKYAPVIVVDNKTNVLIQQCIFESSNGGHSFYRESNGFGNVPVALQDDLFFKKDRPGYETFRNNMIQSENCQFCPIKVSSNLRMKNCLSDRETTRYQSIALENTFIQTYKQQKSKFLASIPANAPKLMIKSVKRWNLLPPYNTQQNWSGYWNKRSQCEKGFRTSSPGHTFSKPLKDVLKKSQREIQTIIKSIKPKLPEWKPESHSAFPADFRREIFTVLLCWKRLQRTCGGVWWFIPWDIFYLIFNNLADISAPKEIPPEFPLLRSSLYITGVTSEWSEVDGLRVLRVNSSLFSPQGTGNVIDIQFSWQMRSRNYYVELNSNLICEMTGCEVKTPLFEKIEHTYEETIEQIVASEIRLQNLSDYLFGSPFAMNPYTLFRVLYYAGGCVTEGLIESWPLRYAKKELFYKDLAPNKECPRFILVGEDSDSDDDDGDDASNYTSIHQKRNKFENTNFF